MKEFKKKTIKLHCTKVVLDQLLDYQVMVFETPSDHFFQRSITFSQNFGRPPIKKGNKHKNTIYMLSLNYGFGHPWIACTKYGSLLRAGNP